MSEKKPILCLDFDGVLHSYTSGWQGADAIPDAPVKGAMEFIAKAIKHFNVQIFSSRSNQNGGLFAMQTWVRNQLEYHFGTHESSPYIDIMMAIGWPSEKPPAMVTIDDRAITFTGEWPDIDDLLSFRPWNKKGTSKEVDTFFITQEQPQPHGMGLPVGERLIELIRERTKLGIEKYGEPLTTHNGRDPMLDALQESIDLNQCLMQALMETEDKIREVTQILHEAIPLNKELLQRIDGQWAEIKRLSEEQIKPLADFLMQQSDVIGHPGDEGACAMAIRVMGELLDGN